MYPFSRQHTSRSVFLHGLTTSGQGVLNLLCRGLPQTSFLSLGIKTGLLPSTWHTECFCMSLWPFLRSLHIQLPHLFTLQDSAKAPPPVPLDLPGLKLLQWVPSWVGILNWLNTAHSQESTHNGYSSVYSMEHHIM